MTALPNSERDEARPTREGRASSWQRVGRGSATSSTFAAKPIYDPEENFSGNCLTMAPASASAVWGM
ncbi:MAG TPA: hypothetical protein VGB03_07010, partial [Acidimicrobiales bacterium]